MSFLDSLPTNAGEVIFLTGAGVSADAPSNGPTGPALTKRALDLAFDSHAVARVLQLYKQTNMPGEYPRLETILGVVIDVLGSSVLAQILDPLVNLTPNALHHFFASHLVAGGMHVTANIDLAIEAALGSPLPSAAQRLFHFHGQLGDGISTLGVTLRNVERGFSSAESAQLDQIFLARGCQAIIVVGYSGSDYFDMEPYFRSLRDRRSLTGKTVIWGVFDESISAPVQVATDFPASAAMLADAGAELHVVRGPTMALLDLLSVRFGLGNPPIGPQLKPRSAQAARPRPDPNLSVGATDKLRSTVGLLSTLGLPGELLRFVKSHPNIEASEIEGDLAQAYWDAGLYRNAADLWKRCWDGSTNGMLRRTERAAACDWLRGRYLRARRRLLRALHNAALSTTVEFTTKLILADTLSRVLEQMRRLPDTRLIPSKRAQRVLLESLPTLEEARVAGVGIDLQIRLATAIAKATGEPPDVLRVAAMTTQAQTASVSRHLQFRQGDLRDRISGGENPRPGIFRDIFESWERIGGFGNAVRILTIPGSQIDFGMKQSLRLIFDRRVDYTFYHRVRLVLVVMSIRLAKR